MSHARSGTLSHRHQTVRSALTDLGLDALVITTLPNILYLTNFKGSAATVVLTMDRLVFVTDFRYVKAIEEVQASPQACPELELVIVDGSYDATLARVLGANASAKSVGFEAAHLTVSRHQWLVATLGASAPAIRLCETQGLVERARSVKDADELLALREGGRRLSDVARAAFAEVRAGRREDEVALAIDWLIRRAGFERTAFDTIVAAGPNGALPHARPTERKLVEGDVVVLDFGGVYDSYCVDLTRTVVLGAASARAREVHGAVARARARAVAAVHVGQSRFAVDEAARTALGEAGMAEAFGHGTGHGLGLEVHEEPRIVRRRPDSDLRDEYLAAGMVFTIEPGAYFPGWGGVRIEDDVALTDRGVELLTDVTTELLEL
jgi:Xaa-Pro aminopeptidase